MSVRCVTKRDCIPSSQLTELCSLDLSLSKLLNGRLAKAAPQIHSILGYHVAAVATIISDGILRVRVSTRSPQSAGPRRESRWRDSSSSPPRPPFVSQGKQVDLFRTFGPRGGVEPKVWGRKRGHTAEGLIIASQKSWALSCLITVLKMPMFQES